MTEFLPNRPTANREITSRRAVHKRALELGEMQQAGVRNFNQLGLGGRFRVSMEVKVGKPIKIRDVVISNRVLTEIACNPPQASDCQCFRDEWTESYTVEVPYTAVFVRISNVTGTRREYPRGGGTWTIQVADEPHTATIIWCSGSQDLEIPENYASLGPDELGLAMKPLYASTELVQPGVIVASSATAMAAVFIEVEAETEDDLEYQVSHFLPEKRIFPVAPPPNEEQAKERQKYFAHINANIDGLLASPLAIPRGPGKRRRKKR